MAWQRPKEASRPFAASYTCDGGTPNRSFRVSAVQRKSSRSLSTHSERRAARAGKHLRTCLPDVLILSRRSTTHTDLPDAPSGCRVTAYVTPPRTLAGPRALCLPFAPHCFSWRSRPRRGGDGKVERACVQTCANTYISGMPGRIYHQSSVNAHTHSHTRVHTHTRT